MMKIIFLDIDGVLNHQVYYGSEEWKEYEKNYTGGGINYSKELDPVAVKNLESIINATKAKIVISSTWRNNMDNVKEALQGRKFDTSSIIDRTPYGCKSCIRGNEIDRWLRNNEKIYESDYYKYKNYIIIDDDSDMLLWQKDNFIHANTRQGLTSDLVYKAIVLLNKEN